MGNDKTLTISLTEDEYWLVTGALVALSKTKPHKLFEAAALHRKFCNVWNENFIRGEIMSVETHEEIITRMMYEEQVRKEIRSKQQDAKIITLTILVAVMCVLCLLLY